MFTSMLDAVIERSGDIGHVGHVVHVTLADDFINFGRKGIKV